MMLLLALLARPLLANSSMEVVGDGHCKAYGGEYHDYWVVENVNTIMSEWDCNQRCLAEPDCIGASYWLNLGSPSSPVGLGDPACSLSMKKGRSLVDMSDYYTKCIKCGSSLLPITESSGSMHKCYARSHLQSGHCYADLDESQCREWARSNGLSFSTFKYSLSPPGCYQFFKNGDTAEKWVYFNANGAGSCTDKRRCVCAMTQRFRTSGHCANILTEAQCRQWAVDNNAKSFSEFKYSLAPRGCYQYHSGNSNNLRVYYNAQGPGECSIYRRCLCA